ncbi:MAG: hypothetical protein U0L23_07535 [Lachnospiraceae bacterium]|nr:hypothetical protein [Lachnospiraceae bacterium]
MKMLTISYEKDIEVLVSQMSDRIRMLDYSKEQILTIIEDYVKINLLDMKYQTREAVLNMICDAVNYYDIRRDMNCEPLIAIRDDLEEDLKEYVDEIIYEHHN